MKKVFDEWVCGWMICLGMVESDVCSLYDFFNEIICEFFIVVIENVVWLDIFDLWCFCFYEVRDVMFVCYDYVDSGCC